MLYRLTNGTASSSYDAEYMSLTWNANTWTFIATCINLTNAKIWKDGSNSGLKNTGLIGSIGSPYAIWLGRGINATIDDVRLYRRWLTDTEIDKIRNNTHRLAGNATTIILDAESVGSTGDTWKNVSVSADIPSQTNVSILWNYSSNNISYSMETVTNNATSGQMYTFTNKVRYGSLILQLQTVNSSLTPTVYNVTMHSMNASDAGLPTVSLNSPANSLLTNNATRIFNCSATSPNQLTNITLYTNQSSWTAKNSTNITGTSNFSQWVNTLADGSYIWNCLAYDNTGNSSFAESNYTLTIDTIPPSTITNLQNQSQSDSWIYWNWTNPGDFNHSEIYLNGTWKQNTSLSYYNATDLNASTWYQISIRTVDLAGNINTTWVNSTARTTSDTTPPVINVTYPTNGTAFAAGKTETWINITTDENATCRYSTNASFVFADGTNFTNTGSMNHSFLYSGLTDNTAYGLYYLCNDTYSNVNTQATYHTFSVSSAAVTPTTPSGGGGGSGGSTTTKTITVMPNEPLTKVIVNLKQSLDSPSLTVAKVESVPVSTPTEPVYQYINITKSRFNNTQIENATIDFKVNRSWISANNFTKIYLAHYDNGWNKLRTDLVNSTATTNYYRAYTNAFSYFAIIGEKAPTPENPSGIPPAEEQKEEQPQETPKVETQGQPEVQEKKTPYFAYIIAAIVLIIAAYALSIKAKEKSRDSEEPISEPVKRETPKKPISQKRAKEDNIDDIQKRLEEIRKKLNQKS